LRIVLDTTVLVSGLLKVHSPPARIVDMILIERVRCVFDDRILAEYAEVLGRPKFRPALDSGEGEQFLDFLRRTGEGVSAPPLPLAGPAPDAYDLPFAEAAVAGAAEAIVTGNLKHFEFFQGNAWGIEILPPAGLVARLCAQGPDPRAG
jgi:putative PIN family toxin of toxin-antitoxin system